MTDDKVDLVPIVREELPGILALPFDSAIEALHQLERRTRIAKDDKANVLVCHEVVNLCISQHRWVDLGTNITILSKRRGYSRTAITEIVQVSMNELSNITDEETKINLVQVLRDVTEGKIFVEVERARLTQILVNYLEAQGKLVESLDLLQDLRLEILTKMDAKDRIPLMLHQFRLCLDAKDQLRASLCSEKFKDQTVGDSELRLQFLKLLIRYNTEFTKDFLATANSYYEMYTLNHDTHALLDAIVNAVLAPHSNEQLQFCIQLQKVKDLTLLHDAKNLLDVFLGRDLVPWAQFEPKFAKVIPDDNRIVMRQRVIEHSLRVVSMFYTNIRLKRLAQLLRITENELEDRIIDLVFNEGFYAKIDRPKGVITFKRKQKVGEVADDFSSNIMKLCKLVDQVHSLIEKEKQCIRREKV